MESILTPGMLGLTALLILLWIGDALARRARRPRPVPFELRAPETTVARVSPLPAPAAPSAPEIAPAAPPVPPIGRVEPPAAPVVPVPAAPAEAAPTVAPVPAEVAPEPVVAPVSWFERLRAGLSKTRASLGDSLAGLFSGSPKLDANLLEEIETLLLTADVGIAATTEIIDTITQKLERKQLKDTNEVRAVLRQELLRLLAPCTQPLVLEPRGPFVILVVGVNGVGKTTTIGKLARRFQQEGKTVMLAAGDTFRAAAVEQLQVWGQRNQVPVIAQHTGADSASVIFDALQAAKARQIDVVIADTAGRLQNKEHLMGELQKVVRVIRKHDPEAPHEVLLVVDAGTGQNALSQAQLFREAVGVSGIAVTKLDGTAKGGIMFAMAKQHPLPIRFIGVGEGIEDLRPFDAESYVQALFD